MTPKERLAAHCSCIYCAAQQGDVQAQEQIEKSHEENTCECDNCTGNDSYTTKVLYTAEHLDRAKAQGRKETLARVREELEAFMKKNKTFDTTDLEREGQDYYKIDYEALEAFVREKLQ